jgi:hypothetical protein
VRRHDAGPGAAARAYMWGRSKSKIVKLTAPGARQPVESAELYAVLAFHCGQGPMIRRRTSRQPRACATAPSSPCCSAARCASARWPRAPTGAVSGGFTVEAMAAARHGNTPEPTTLYTTASIIAYPRSQLRRSTCRARGISESVALRVLCSNYALSPAHQRACRSGRDSQSFSCGGGTPHTRDDSSSQ